MRCWFIFVIICITTALTAHGRQVVGRPTLPSDCIANEVWVRDHSKVTGNWTAYCRVRTGGSHSQSYDYWAPRFKPGRPSGWPFPGEFTANWQSSDIQNVFWAVERIPKSLWGTEIHGIYRMNRSRDYPNPGIFLQNNIVLYDSAFQNEEYLARIFAHELAHARFAAFDDTRRVDYASAAGWKSLRSRGSNRIFIPPESGFVRSVGHESIDEDFANNIEYFLFQPNTLRNTNSSAYEWIQRNFGSDFKFRRDR